jgi:hypothetical protein
MLSGMRACSASTSGHRTVVDLADAPLRCEVLRLSSAAYNALRLSQPCDFASWRGQCRCSAGMLYVDLDAPRGGGRPASLPCPLSCSWCLLPQTAGELPPSCRFCSCRHVADRAMLAARRPGPQLTPDLSIVLAAFLRRPIPGPDTCLLCRPSLCWAVAAAGAAPSPPWRRDLGVV